jgi:ATP-dependent Clp protease ATP-binding subunit ClpA
MARIIQQHIKKPLAEELLFGKLANGGHIVIREQDGSLEFMFEEEECVEH